VGISDTIKKLPLINSDSKKIRIAGYILYAWLGLSVLGAILPTPDSSSPDESKTAEEWIREGQAEYDEQNYDAALQAYEEAIKINPQNANAWYKKGILLYSKNINALDDRTPEDYNEALDALNKAVELDPKNIAYLFGKTDVLSVMDRYDEAVETCDQILEVSPMCYSALIDKSYYLLSDERPEEALQAAEEAIEINPDSLMAWAKKSDALYELGRESDAVVADGVYQRLSNSENAVAPLTNAQILLIKKWYPIGISSDDIALDIGALYYEPRVNEAVEKMIKNGELVRRAEDDYW
jgi:tetratricopeptide (TPR) repeat protein